MSNELIYDILLVRGPLTQALRCRLFRMSWIIARPWHNADEYATDDAIDECLLEKMDESKAILCAPLCLLQFLQGAFKSEGDASNGSWNHRSYLDTRRIDQCLPEWQLSGSCRGLRMAIGNRILRRTCRSIFLPAVATLIVVSVCDRDQINYHNEGQIDARSDLKSHNLIIKLTGMRLQEEGIYRETLKRIYGIELDRVAGCIVEAHLADYVDGYDEVMAEAIEKLFGQGVFGEELWIAPHL